MTLDEAKKYFEGHIAALNRMIPDGDPWVFLCASVVIDYLARLAAGQDDGGEGYKRFIKSYMPEGYRTFKYDFEGGKADLPEQMYHILRCGIVHSFSFIPNDKARKKGGRDRSVVISHDDPHLSNHRTVDASDACCLRADRFISDIEVAMRKLFTDAETDATLAAKMLGWLRDHPPIKALP